MMSLSLPHTHTHTHTRTHTHERGECVSTTLGGLCEWNEVFRRLSVTIKCVWLWRGGRDKEAKGRARKTDSRKTRERERERERERGSVSLQSLCLPACRSASPLATLWWIVGSDDTWQLPLLYSNTGRDTAERPAGFTQRAPLRSTSPSISPSFPPSSLPRLFLFSHCCFSRSSLLNIQAFYKKQHIHICASKSNFLKSVDTIFPEVSAASRQFKMTPLVLVFHLGFYQLGWHFKVSAKIWGHASNTRRKSERTRHMTTTGSAQHSFKPKLHMFVSGEVDGLKLPKVLCLFNTTLQPVFLSLWMSSLFTLPRLTPSFADVIISTTTRGRCKAKKHKHGS